MDLSFFRYFCILFLLCNPSSIHASFKEFPSVLSLFSFIPLSLTKCLITTIITLKVESTVIPLDTNQITEAKNSSMSLDEASFQNAHRKIQDLIGVMNDLQKKERFLILHHKELGAFLKIGKDPISLIRHNELVFVLMGLKEATGRFIQASLDMEVNRVIQLQPGELQNLLYLLGRKLLKLNNLTLMAQEKMTQLKTCHYRHLIFSQLVQYKPLFSELHTLIENVSQLDTLQAMAKEAFLSKTKIFSQDWDDKDTQVALLLSSAFQNFTLLQTQMDSIENSEAFETKSFLTHLLDQVQKLWQESYLKNYKGLEYTICLGLMKSYTKLSTEEGMVRFTQSELAKHQYPCKRSFQDQLFNRELVNQFPTRQMSILAAEESKTFDLRGYL